MAKQWSVTFDLHFAAFFGTKELYLTPDGRIIEAKGGVTAILPGAEHNLGSRVFAGPGAGLAFYNGQAHPAFRPLVGLSVGHRRRGRLYLSLTHVVQRDEISYQGFGYLSFGIAGLL